MHGHSHSQHNKKLIPCPPNELIGTEIHTVLHANNNH